MKIYQVIFQDEYNNLYELGYYKDLKDAIPEINAEIGVAGFELQEDDLKEYASTFSSVFDLDLTNLTEDEQLQDELAGKMVRGFILDSDSVIETINELESSSPIENMSSTNKYVDALMGLDTKITLGRKTKQTLGNDPKTKEDFTDTMIGCIRGNYYDNIMKNYKRYASLLKSKKITEVEFTNYMQEVLDRYVKDGLDRLSINNN